MIGILIFLSLPIFGSLVSVANHSWHVKLSEVVWLSNLVILSAPKWNWTRRKASDVGIFFFFISLWSCYKETVGLGKKKTSLLVLTQESQN